MLPFQHSDTIGHGVRMVTSRLNALKNSSEADRARYPLHFLTRLQVEILVLDQGMAALQETLEYLRAENTNVQTYLAADLIKPQTGQCHVFTRAAHLLNLPSVDMFLGQQPRIIVGAMKAYLLKEVGTAIHRTLNANIQQGFESRAIRESAEKNFSMISQIWRCYDNTMISLRSNVLVPPILTLEQSLCVLENIRGTDKHRAATKLTKGKLSASISISSSSSSSSAAESVTESGAGLRYDSRHVLYPLHVFGRTAQEQSLALLVLHAAISTTKLGWTVDNTQENFSSLVNSLQEEEEEEEEDASSRNTATPTYLHVLLIVLYEMFESIWAAKKMSSGPPESDSGMFESVISYTMNNVDELRTTMDRYEAQILKRLGVATPSLGGGGSGANEDLTPSLIEIHQVIMYWCTVKLAMQGIDAFVNTEQQDVIFVMDPATSHFYNFQNRLRTTSSALRRALTVFVDRVNSGLQRRRVTVGARAVPRRLPPPIAHSPGDDGCNESTTTSDESDSEDEEGDGGANVEPPPLLSPRPRAITEATRNSPKSHAEFPSTPWRSTRHRIKASPEHKILGRRQTYQNTREHTWSLPRNKFPGS